MGRRMAAMAGMGLMIEPGRARYKDVRTRTSKVLSAHLFSVCACRNLRQTQSDTLPDVADAFVSYARLDER